MTADVPAAVPQAALHKSCRGMNVLAAPACRHAPKLTGASAVSYTASLDSHLAPAPARVGAVQARYRRLPLRSHRQLRQGVSR